MSGRSVGHWVGSVGGSLGRGGRWVTGSGRSVGGSLGRGGRSVGHWVGAVGRWVTGSGRSVGRVGWWITVVSVGGFTGSGRSVCICDRVADVSACCFQGTVVSAMGLEQVMELKKV